MTRLLVAVACLIAPSFSWAEETGFKVRVTGLFAPDRVNDLRRLVAEWPGIKLESVDFDRAEATLRFDAGKLYPKASPEQIVQKLDEKLRSASNGTFGIKPPSTTPRDRLVRVEIAVVGLDCKACCLAAYEIVAKIDGVEQATASFKDGRVTALIDPKKTDKAKLEATLKQRGVAVR